jgi:hypothetical protein
MCGGHTKDLPIAYRQGKWWSANEIAMIADLSEVALIVDPLTIEYRLKVLKTYELYESVFVARFRGQPGLLQTGHHHTAWPNAASGDWHMAALGLAVVESLARAWHAPLTDVLAANDLQRESDVVIGRDGDRELRAEALVIRKPTTMLEKAGPSN